MELNSVIFYNVCHFRVYYFPPPVNIFNEEFKCMQPYASFPSNNYSEETKSPVIS